jgi:hypothetical protein
MFANICPGCNKRGEIFAQPLHKNDISSPLYSEGDGEAS